jgi:glyoxylase-like metal-dependent hydrolase (beta-lactamase superfamily II)
MVPAKTVSPPPNVRYLFCNYLIISENRRGFLLDCGTKQGFDMIEEFFKSGELEAIDICYITHYHHDHVDMLDKLQKLYSCKIYAPQSFADMLENPEAYYITCLSDISVTPEILPDNHAFTWEGYEFEHFEFPGQTLYHGGLLFDDKAGNRILFCGDSFAPTGFDDYCPQNRNFTGRNRGYNKCLDIIEQKKPGCLINQHQEKAFIYTKKEIAFLRDNLEKRDKLLGDLTMWPTPDYSLDPYWVRMYPYFSKIKPGEICSKELQITNHTENPANVKIKFTASKGVVIPGDIEMILPPMTCGLVDYDPADIRIPVNFSTDEKDLAETYAVGAEIWLDGVYFGEICKGVIFVGI